MREIRGIGTTGYTKTINFNSDREAQYAMTAKSDALGSVIFKHK